MVGGYVIGYNLQMYRLGPKFCAPFLSPVISQPALATKKPNFWLRSIPYHATFDMVGGYVIVHNLFH